MSYETELDPLEAREAFNDSQKEIKLKEVNKNYSKYLTITKNEVHTKFRAIVRLPLDEYKVNDNEMLNKEDFEMIAGDQSSYSVPGTFEIEFPEEGISLNIFLPYNVNIMKTEDSTINSKEMVFNYEEGDLIFNAFVKKIETNIEILNSMFENRVRYLRGYISEQHEAIWSQMASTSNVKAIHIANILSMLYAKKEGNELKFIRHTQDQEYKKEYAINTKESSHLFNTGAQSSNYGYVGDALFASIFKDRKNKYHKSEEDHENGFYLGNPDEGTKPKLQSENQALLFNIDREKINSIDKMSRNYSDLENVIASRYEELTRRKETNS